MPYQSTNFSGEQIAEVLAIMDNEPVAKMHFFDARRQIASSKGHLYQMNSPFDRETESLRTKLEKFDLFTVAEVKIPDEWNGNCFYDYCMKGNERFAMFLDVLDSMALL